MSELPCPKCGQEAESYPGCPTYPMGEYPDGRPRMMRCWPECGNATKWRCSDENCDWHYVDGLHPKNPRSESNEKNRPEWAAAGGDE